MEAELAEIQEFLAQHPPFSTLPEDALAHLPKQLSIRYCRRDSVFPPSSVQSIASHPDDGALYILRRGAVELRDGAAHLLAKLGEGDLYDAPCTGDSTGEQEGLVGQAVEDTLVYVLPCEAFAQLRAEHPAFAEHFGRSLAERLRQAHDTVVETATEGADLMTMRVGDILTRGPVATGPETSIREAARVMSAQNVSSLLVMDDAALIGIVTDRDLRNRCLAAGLSGDEPVSAIMSERLSTLAPESPAFQALLTMTQRNVHHLPVLDGERVIGLLSSTDLTRLQSSGSLYLIGDIQRAGSSTQLAEIASRIPRLQLHLANSGATAQHLGQAMSAATDALTERLLVLAEIELGPPPVPYAWLVAGSQARREQSAHSDQDNGLLIADDLRPEHDAYFAALARFVNDGLAACGFVYCPGEIMASNPKWRQPLRVWRQYFADWILNPEPMALMLSSIFFDLRALHDRAGLFAQLQHQVLERARNNRIFIAYLVANALKNRPPLGFFRNIVVIHGGEHDHTFDIKHRALAPLVDLARIHALSVGHGEINTTERLRVADRKGAISREGAASLLDAYEFFGALRMRHQAQQVKAGESADNFLAPADLSRLERGYLKDAFRLIATIQESLGQRYQSGRLA